MSVTDTTTTIAYTGDGGSLIFAFPYYFKSFDDLVVMVRTADLATVTTKILTTDYSVSGIIDPKLNTYAAGGNVTFVIAPATGTQVRISRRTPKVQASVYVNGDPFPVESHEVSQDTQTLIQQEAGVYLFDADGPPTAGTFREGDKVRNANRAPGGFEGWIRINGLWYECNPISQTAAG